MRQRECAVAVARAVGRCTPDPHDVGDATTVLEVAVHGVCQVVALDEVTEVLLELGPVGDEHRFVHESPLGEAHEGGHRGAHGLDRPGTRGDLLHIHAGREVAASHLGYLPRYGA
jgi:hypothetical protein